MFVPGKKLKFLREERHRMLFYKIGVGEFGAALLHGTLVVGVRRGWNAECNLFDARPATENLRSDGVDEPDSLYTST